MAPLASAREDTTTPKLLKDENGAHSPVPPQRFLPELGQKGPQPPHGQFEDESKALMHKSMQNAQSEATLSKRNELLSDRAGNASLPNVSAHVTPRTDFFRSRKAGKMA